MMRCDQARVLIGVHDELDTPTRRALQAHVESCRACAEAWLEEAEFLRLMAARSARSTPPPSPQLEARLLAVPARDLALARLRAQAARLGPPALLVLGLALGAFWTVQRFTGPDDGARVDLAALSADVPGAAQSGQRGPASGAPAPQAAVGPAVIARQRPGALSGATDRGSASSRARLASAASGAAPGSRLNDRPTASSAPSRRGVAAAGAPLSPPAAESLPEPSSTALPTTAAPGRSSVEVPPPADPTAVPPPRDPTVAPPAGPTAPVWQLDLKVLLDDPGGDLTGAAVVVQIETQVDGTWATLYEEPLVFAGRVAEDRPRLDRPPPYEVELFAALAGYALCPGESRSRTVDAGALVDRQGEIRFHLCAQARPVPEVTGSATAPATATSPPATATAPPATPTPSPVDVTAASGR